MDLSGIQNQNGIKHNRMGQEQTGVFQLQIRYASYSANQWLSPTLEAPLRLLSTGLFLFLRHPASRSDTERGTGDGGGVLAESLGKSYPWAVGFFSRDSELPK